METIDYQRLHAQLLDMLGAKDHEDAARIIAGHHAREIASQPAERGEAVAKAEPVAPARYREFAEFYAKLNDVFGRRFPRCRDCADEDGTCPQNGLPCDWPKLPPFTHVTATPPAAGVPDGMALVPKRFIETVRAAGRNGVHPRAVPVLIEEALEMLSAAPEAKPHG